MKRLKYVLSFFLVCIIMMVTVNGSDTISVVLEYPDDDMTVIFENAVYDNYERYERIANRLVYGDEYSTDKILSWCWLFGHDIQSDAVDVITHNVRSVSPKCLRETYKVETCSKCDYYRDELITSAYIVCH